MFSLPLTITTKDDKVHEVVATQGDFVDLESFDRDFDMNALSPSVDADGNAQLRLRWTWFSFLGWNVARRTGLTDQAFDEWRYENEVQASAGQEEVPDLPGEADGGRPTAA